MNRYFFPDLCLIGANQISGLLHTHTHTHTKRNTPTKKKHAHILLYAYNLDHSVAQCFASFGKISGHQKKKFIRIKEDDLELTSRLCSFVDLLYNDRNPQQMELIVCSWISEVATARQDV